MAHGTNFNDLVTLPLVNWPAKSSYHHTLSDSGQISDAFSSVQFSCSVVSDSLWPHEPQHTRPPCPSQLPESTQTHDRWISGAIQSSRLPLSPSPPALNHSQPHGLFKWVSSLYQVAKILEFSFNISPSNEHPGLVSFRMDWLDLLAVQGTLKSLLQHHRSKESILRCSAFFIVQLSYPYMTPGKTITLTRWTFAEKVMSLLFHMLSRLVITFFSRSKHLLISWLQSSSAVILEPEKIKLVTVYPFICYSDGTRCHDLCFLNVEL